MIPWISQTELAKEGLAILRKNGLVYLAMEERTGKTLTAILIAEEANVNKVLVITKPKPLKDWLKTLKAFKHAKHFDVDTYHQVHKIDFSSYDLVILDESHNFISAFPKPGATWKELKPKLVDKPLIYISATPYSQGPQMLYHQFSLSSWSPWASYKTFYSWFRTYGQPYEIDVQGRKITQYNRCDRERILACVSHLFIIKTRKELNFEHEPQDKVHYVELAPETKELYNTIVDDKIVQLPDFLLVCDTVSKERTSLHQLEGGTMKCDSIYTVLENTEKIDYILKHFGDTSDMVIMFNYKAELVKLSKHFKNATILQATSYAEGIDLHRYKHLIVYSQDFSTARHTQRRARQCNMQREEPIIVHYLLVKKALSEQVYKTVSLNKRNFVDSVYSREKL